MLAQLTIRMIIKRIILAIFIVCMQITTCKDTPKILTTNWAGHDTSYSISSSTFKVQPIFESFDKAHIEQHLLPRGPISYRNNQIASVTGAHLSSCIEQTIEELKAGKSFTHVTVVKNKEFHVKQCAGCLVLKFNDHPFILKLFIENPYSFLHPQHKGFQHSQMFFISGGINRYLAGFGRIKNLEHIRKTIAMIPEYTHIIDVPRKWFWLPTNPRYFELHGKGFQERDLLLTLPEVYAIVADEIVTSTPLHTIRKHYGKTIFNICKTLEFCVDPNMKNFRLEQETNKLVLIDTEHFPTLLGNSLDADNYFFLHLKIGYKVVHDHVSALF